MQRTLQLNQLVKRYSNGVLALNHLQLHIEPGMFGLLGPNGAGKSSLMRTIATLQQPDAGSIAFGDIDPLQDPMALRRVLGYLPQDFGVYPKTSAEELLLYFARLKGITSKAERKAKVEEVLELTNLQEVRRKHVSSYSGGMRQRFGIAQLLLNDPQLLIVDEPTAGLDPAERSRFLNVLRKVGTESTVIFSTHIVDEVRDLCQDMAIVQHGRVLLQARPAEAVAMLQGQIWTCQVDPAELAAAEAAHEVLSHAYTDAHDCIIRVWASTRPSEHFAPAEPNLEDVYFHTLRAAQTTEA